ADHVFTTRLLIFVDFFLMHTAMSEIYTLSLHDALPICSSFFDLQPAAKLMLFSQILELDFWLDKSREADVKAKELAEAKAHTERSEEHTSELQSPYDLVCRLLLEIKK